MADAAPAASDSPLLHDVPIASLPAAVAVLARSFEDYPPFAYIAPPGKTRAFVSWMFSRYVHAVLQVPGSRVLCNAEGEKITCVSLLLPPNEAAGANLGFKDTSLCSLLRHGLYELPFRFGVRCLWRALALLLALENSEALITKQIGSFVYQDYLCVSPDCQSNGLGAAALAAGMAEMSRRCGSQHPAVLNTYSERARRFYTRAGFVEIGSHQAGRTVYWFVRPAPGQPPPDFQLPSGWTATPAEQI
jgi:GNAT superfamily N-acetyltransferase